MLATHGLRNDNLGEERSGPITVNLIYLLLFGLEAAQN